MHANTMEKLDDLIRERPHLDAKHTMQHLLGDMTDEEIFQLSDEDVAVAYDVVWRLNDRPASTF